MGYTIAIIGSIGSGKSTVINEINKLKFTTLKLDDVANKYILEHQELIFSTAGVKNRLEFVNKMYNDIKVNEKIKKLVHPYVFKYMKDFCDKQKLTFVEIPLIQEPLFNNFFNEKWLVYASIERQIKNMKKREPQSPTKDIEAKIKINHSNEYFKTVADKIIMNDGDKKKLKKKVQNLLRYISNNHT